MRGDLGLGNTGDELAPLKKGLTETLALCSISKDKKKGLTELGNFDIEEDKNYILRNKVEMESHED